MVSPAVAGIRNFALVGDLTVAFLGGDLKTKQKLTGRLADMLSELYLLCCVLKRYEDDGKPANDRHYRALAPRTASSTSRRRCAAPSTTSPSPVRWLMRAVVFPLGAHYKPAPDWLGHKVVELVLTPGEVRDRLTRLHLSCPTTSTTRPALLEVTMAKVVAAEVADKKLDRAVRAGQVRRVHGADSDRRCGQARRHHRRPRRQLLREVEQRPSG